jgi:hypothetical protein
MENERTGEEKGNKNKWFKRRNNKKNCRKQRIIEI